MNNMQRSDKHLVSSRHYIPREQQQEEEKRELNLPFTLIEKKNNQVSIEFIEKKTRENEPVVIDIKL